MIQPPDWGKDVFLEWYGVDLWGEAEELAMYLDTWAVHHMDLKDVQTSSQVNRIAFERYLQAYHLMPLTFAADQLAVAREDFHTLLDEMVREKLLMADAKWEQSFCGTNLPEELPNHLPSFPKRVYPDVPSRIRAFHDAVNKDLGFDLAIVETETLDGGVKKPGHTRDILTSSPVALGDSVWLNLGKPVSLRPDVCSKRTYLDFRDQLSELLMGPEPEWARDSSASFVAESSEDYA